MPSTRIPYAACLLLAIAMTARAVPAPAAGDVRAPASAAPDEVIVSGAVDGRSTGRWTVEWWRWAKAQQVAPYRDPDGRLCAVGQAGPVWFLAGTTGDFTARRRCVVPEGKHLLVPVINMVYWQREGRDSCASLQADAAVNNDRLVSAVVLLDGRPLGDMRAQRARSDGCFRLDPDDTASRLGAADGYWLMLAPLPRGRHVLKVGANYGASASGYGAMVQQFEYVLEVGGTSLVGSAAQPASAPVFAAMP